MGVGTAAVIAGIIVGATKITQAAMTRRKERQLLEAGWTKEDQALQDQLNKLQKQGRGLTDQQMRQQQLTRLVPVNAAAQQDRDRLMSTMGMQGAGIGITAKAMQQSANQQQQMRAQAANQIAQDNIQQYQQNQVTRRDLSAQRASIEAQQKASKTQRTMGVLTGIGSGVSTALGAYQTGQQEQEFIKAPDSSMTEAQKEAVLADEATAGQTYGFKGFMKDVGAGLGYANTGEYNTHTDTNTDVPTPIQADAPTPTQAETQTGDNKALMSLVNNDLTAYDAVQQALNTGNQADLPAIIEASEYGDYDTIDALTNKYATQSTQDTQQGTAPIRVMPTPTPITTPPAPIGTGGNIKTPVLKNTEAPTMGSADYLQIAEFIDKDMSQDTLFQMVGGDSAAYIALQMALQTGDKAVVAAILEAVDAGDTATIGGILKAYGLNTGDGAGISHLQDGLINLAGTQRASNKAFYGFDSKYPETMPIQEKPQPNEAIQADYRMLQLVGGDPRKFYDLKQAIRTEDLVKLKQILDTVDMDAIDPQDPMYNSVNEPRSKEFTTPRAR